MLVKQYNWCHWQQQQPVKGSYSKTILDLLLFYVQLLFTTVFHDLCISGQKPFFLFNSLPNALFIVEFLDVSGVFAKSYSFLLLFFFCPSVYEQKFPIN